MSNFKKNLQYDYKKYTTKLDELLNQINAASRNKIVSGNPEVITSTTWHNAHNEESYNEAKERLETEKAKEVHKNKSTQMKRWIDHGLFQRRLQFDNGSNFYVTTATIDVDYSFNGDFLIAYWGTDSDRVETLMKFDIGDESPANGELLLTGDFTPNKKDLTHIRYKNTTGKEEYQSAQNALHNIEVSREKTKSLIDTNAFFRLKFSLAGLGEQSKALYDTNNSIMDGAAGTGKSTIALQKLKYLHVKHNIPQNKMALIVKNEQAISHFSTLLNDEELTLSDIKTFTASDFLTSLHVDNSIDISVLDQCKNDAENIKKVISQSIKTFKQSNLKEHLLNLVKNIGSQRLENTLNSMLDEIKNDQNIQVKISDIDEEIQQINEDLVNDDIADEQKLSLITSLKNSKNRRDQLSGKNYTKALTLIVKSPEKISIAVLKDIEAYHHAAQDLKKFTVLHWIKKYSNYLMDQESTQKRLEDIQTQINTFQNHEQFENELQVLNSKIELIEENEDLEHDKVKASLKVLKNERKSLRDAVKKFNDLSIKKERFEEKLSQSFKIERKDRENYETVLNGIYMTQDFISKNFPTTYTKVQSYLTTQYLLENEKPFNTIIIDEAQDYTLVELELLRFQATRIILTGDILQSIEKNNFDGWESILNVNKVYGVENRSGDHYLNIFSLKHNFRQTYQLANASFNFRQLLLKGGLEDIEKEYYRSEKEFEGTAYKLPLVKYFENHQAIKEHITEKLKYIEQTYSSKIPIALIYKDDEERQIYRSLLKHLNMTSSTENIKDVDVLLINIFEAKGKEFPIVMSHLDNLSDNEIYLIMSRAQFELDFFTQMTRCSNVHLQTLIERSWIAMNGLNSAPKEKSTTPSMSAKNETVNAKEAEQSIDEPKTSKMTATKIIDHTATVPQSHEEINPDVIIDEQKYKDEFLKQLEHQQALPRKKDVVFIRKEVDRSNDLINNEIKLFLYKTYKGYCQSCGFTFRKTNDQQNSFEKFNWSDKRVVKVSKEFVSSADSLSLCRNCAANIKFGAFDPLFIEKIQGIYGFETKNLEEIIKIIHNVIDVKTREVFEDHVEFDDMFALEIKLNNEDRNIYFTKEHLMQFITFLQLEKKMEMENQYDN